MDLLAAGGKRSRQKHFGEDPVCCLPQDGDNILDDQTVDIDSARPRQQASDNRQREEDRRHSHVIGRIYAAPLDIRPNTVHVI